MNISSLDEGQKTEALEKMLELLLKTNDIMSNIGDALSEAQESFEELKEYSNDIGLEMAEILNRKPEEAAKAHNKITQDNNGE